MGSFKILIPNAITFFRLLSVGIIFWLISLKHFQIAGVLLFFALISDLIDGPIARCLGQVTRFGYFFDHIVDYFLFVVVIYLILKYLLPSLGIFYLILQVLVVIISLFVVFGKIKVSWPNNPGRHSFGFLGACGCSIIFFFETPFWRYFFYLALFLFAIATFLRLWSFWQFFHDLKEGGDKR